MKKILFVLSALVLSLSACADWQQTVSNSELPVQAQTFIKKYFNMDDIRYVEKELDGLHMEYHVYLKNATEIEFDHQGNLEKIDCQTAEVPAGIVPDMIVEYASTHFPQLYIMEYSIEPRHLKVELSNGLELIFDQEGNFLRMDD
jgi:hypothetical protein